jgi:heptosyltransferase I
MHTARSSSDTTALNICLFRLSALGDVTHALTVVRQIQDQLPDARITWIIGRIEHKLLQGLDGVNFVVFNKSDGLRAYRELRRELRRQRFDVLLHMQVSLRANLTSVLVRADRRIGYDRRRSKDFHGFVVNERIAVTQKQHVLDAMQSFIEPLGLKPGMPRWQIPISDEDFAFADKYVDRQRPTLCISPVSSHKLRNWHVAGYAAVADYASRHHDMQIILTGGPTEFEQNFCAQIEAQMKSEVVNLTGQDTLKQLAALMGESDLVLAPDTGPMHIANAMGTDVIGLHAASNPRRSGPYHSLRWCVDQYDAAARRFLNRSADELQWGTKIEYEGVMDLVGIDQVTERLDAWCVEKS